MTNDAAAQDRTEALDRAAACAHLLARVDEELCRLEQIEHLTVEDLDRISMAKGFAARARAALEALK